MLTQPSSGKAFKPSRFLWLTFDFAGCLPAETDTVTPQLFLELMAYPAISQLKRFTAGADGLGPEDVAQWEPGIFTLQAYRASLLDVLTQVASCLAPHLVSANDEGVRVTVYTQVGRKHYPLVTGLGAEDLHKTAEDIETMVSQHEQNQATATQQ